MTDVHEPQHDGVAAAVTPSVQAAQAGSKAANGAQPVEPSPPESATGVGSGRSGFTFPTAYTILFLLLIVMAVLTWIIPAGRYDLNPDGAPIPGTFHNGATEPAGDCEWHSACADHRHLRYPGR